MNVAKYFPEDPKLEGFPRALDTDIVRSALQTYALAPRFECVRCELDRFRYRPGERAVMLFNAGIIDRDTGVENCNWISGSLYAPGKARRRYADGAPRSDRRDEWTSLAPIAFLPELGMLVQAFPVDRHIPSLEMFVHSPPAELFDVLRPLGGKDSCAITDITPMRFRPGLMATLRYTVESKGAGREDRRRQIYVKLHAHDDSRGIEQLQRLSRLSERSSGAFRIASPAAHLANHRAIVLGAARGRSFADLILSTEPIQEASCQVARALAAFHQSDASALPAPTPNRVATKARRSVTLIGWACPEVAPAAARILSFLERMDPPPRFCPTHHDMKPEHVFLENGIAEFIDAESAGADDPVLDLGCMLARLDAMTLMSNVSRARIAAIKGDLEKTYFASVPPDWNKRLPAARAYGGLLVAVHYLQRVVPNWRNRVIAEIECVHAGLHFQ